MGNRREFSVEYKKRNNQISYGTRKKVTHGEDAFPGKGKLKPEDEEKKDGVACGKNRVSRLMNENNIFSKLKRKYKATTY